MRSDLADEVYELLVSIMDDVWRGYRNTGKRYSMNPGFSEAVQKEKSNGAK